MNTRKAISPILATVIIIAVTLVIAIGVIGWIMGIWGTFGKTETLQILPDTALYTNGTVVVHVRNSGTSTAVIYKIEVVNIDSVTTDKGGDTLSTKYSVTPGTDTTIICSIGGEGDYTAGASYQIKVYTLAGNVYSTVVTAESST